MVQDWTQKGESATSSPTPPQNGHRPGRSIPLNPQEPLNFLQFTGFAIRLRLVLAVTGLPVLISFAFLFVVPPDVATANRLPLLLVVLVVVQFASAALLNPPLRRLRRASRSVASSIEGAGAGIASLRHWQEEEQKANLLVAAVLTGVLTNVEKVAKTVQVQQSLLMEEHEALKALSAYVELIQDPHLTKLTNQVDERFKNVCRSHQAFNDTLARIAPARLADAQLGARDHLNQLSSTADSLIATLAQLEHLNQAARELF